MRKTKVRSYFTVQARIWHPDALDLKPETANLKPCPRYESPIV